MVAETTDHDVTTGGASSSINPGSAEILSETAAGAVSASTNLNASLLMVDRERAYMGLKAQYDALTTTYTNQQSQLIDLRRNLSEMQASMENLNDQVKLSRESVQREVARANILEEENKNHRERIARMEIEADSLRQEISRLIGSNTSLSTQLAAMRTDNTMTASSAAPLQFENVRLRSELDALTAHVAWMEAELATRTSHYTKLRASDSESVLKLRSEISTLKSEHDELMSSNGILALKHETTMKQLDSLQRQLLETEKNHADQQNEMTSELIMERRLVALTKEKCAVMEDRYNSAVREMETMKRLATAAKQDHEMDLARLKSEMEREFQNVIQDLKNENRNDELQEQLTRALAEKTKLEDELMGRSNRRNTDVTVRLVTEEEASTAQSRPSAVVGVDCGSLNITDVYDTLADKDEELRHERLERRRVELYLERIQKEIENKGPILRQQRKEYEKAISQRKDMHLRLHEALDELRVMKDEMRQKEREAKEIERECAELRLENGDLAKQVQALLKKFIGDTESADTDHADVTVFGSLEELQTQNQRLLREHHRLMTTVSELQDKLASDAIHTKLRTTESELKQLVQEREHQSILVAGIVQQRDLYRALLAKNDVQILAAIGGETSGASALVAARGQIENLTDANAKVKAMSETIAQLNADLFSANNTRVGLEDRVARLDAYAEDLALSMTKLQTELSHALASAAKNEAEASYHKQNSERLQDVVTSTKTDLMRISESRKELLRVNDELQSALSDQKLLVSRVEQDLYHHGTKLRLAEAQAKAASAAEQRLAGEVASLRMDLTRQGSFIESVQRIETTLSTRAKEDRERLEDEIKRLNQLLSTERARYTIEREKLQSRVADLESMSELLGKKLDESLLDLDGAKGEAAESQSARKELFEKCIVLEKALNAARVRLGEKDADFSDQDELKLRTAELEATKDDLTATRQSCELYKALAQEANNALLALKELSEDFKTNTALEIAKLKEELNLAQRTDQMKQAAFTELANDLSNSRQEQERVVHELKAKLMISESEVQAAKDVELTNKGRIDLLLSEIESLKADVRASNDNYERELAMHALARTDLRNMRTELEVSRDKLNRLEYQLEHLKSIHVSETKDYDIKMDEAQKALHRVQNQLDEGRRLNSLLLSQLDSMRKTTEMLRSDKASSHRVANESECGIAEEDEGNVSREQQMHELREIVNMLQSEREVLESQLDLARRTIEREKATTDVVKRSLESARAELDILMKRELCIDDVSVRQSQPFQELNSRLKSYDEQVKLLRESNQLLRDETEKLAIQLSLAQKDAADAQQALEPLARDRQILEIDKTTLEAEKGCLIREVDAWKERLQSFVTKFHQIDPEEHSKAIAQVNEIKKECAELHIAKDKAEKECTGAKTLISRLNKEMSKLKEQIEAMTKSLETVSAEKDVLFKAHADASSAIAKERDEIIAAKDAIEAELKNVKIEIVGYQSRAEKLTNFLRSTKASLAELTTKLQQTSQSEQEARSSLAKEQEAHLAALKELEELKSSLQRHGSAVESCAPTHESCISSQVSAEIIPVSANFSLNRTGLIASNEAIMDNEVLVESNDVAASRGNLVLENLSFVSQVPLGGFKFSPTPTTDQVIPTVPSQSCDSSPLDTSTVLHVECDKDKTRCDSLALAPLQIDGTGPADVVVDDHAAKILASQSHSSQKPLPDSNEKISSVTNQTDDENTIREKLLKRKRQLVADKKIAKTAELVSVTNDVKDDDAVAITEITRSQQDVPKDDGNYLIPVDSENPLSSSTLAAPGSTISADSSNDEKDPLVSNRSVEESQSLQIPVSCTPSDARESAFGIAPEASPFLNLKPPGQGNAMQLIFGKSPNILIPSPVVPPLQAVALDSSIIPTFSQGDKSEQTQNIALPSKKRTVPCRSDDAALSKVQRISETKDEDEELTKEQPSTVE